VSGLRLYFDADSMQRALISGVRARGIDAVRAVDVELEDAPDEQQLEFATAEGRVLFSDNTADFQRIHTEFLSAGKSHAGIILAPQQRYGLGDQIRFLLKLANARTAAEMQNRLEFLSNWA